MALPEIGGVEVAKMTLPEATARIRSRLSRVFRDLNKLSVTLKERKLLLTVHGYVKAPGNVELPGDATIQMAIIAAGGLVQGAQLDRLVVTSANGKKQTFDYKKFMDTGDMSLMPELQPLDVIFVPASPLTGNVQIEFDGRTLAAAGDGGEERTSIKVFGEVNTPAIFAWKKGANVVDMLMRAGGVTRFSSPSRFRIINRNKPVLFNLQAYLDTGDRALLPEIEPGATIFVPKQVDEVRRGALTVYVMGEVAKPGAFETREGATFIDILANAGGPTRFADTRQIRVIRAAGSIDMVDLPRFTEGKSGALPPVGPGDAIFIPEKTDTQEPSWLQDTILARCTGARRPLQARPLRMVRRDVIVRSSRAGRWAYGESRHREHPHLAQRERSRQSDPFRSGSVPQGRRIFVKGAEDPRGLCHHGAGAASGSQRQQGAVDAPGA